MGSFQDYFLLPVFEEISNPVIEIASYSILYHTFYPSPALLPTHQHPPPKSPYTPLPPPHNQLPTPSCPILKYPYPPPALPSSTPFYPTHPYHHHYSTFYHTLHYHLPLSHTLYRTLPPPHPTHPNLLRYPTYPLSYSYTHQSTLPYPAAEDRIACYAERVYCHSHPSQPPTCIFLIAMVSAIGLCHWILKSDICTWERSEDRDDSCDQNNLSLLGSGG